MSVLYSTPSVETPWARRYRRPPDAASSPLSLASAQDLSVSSPGLFPPPRRRSSVRGACKSDEAVARGSSSHTGCAWETAGLGTGFGSSATAHRDHFHVIDRRGPALTSSSRRLQATRSQSVHASDPPASILAVIKNRHEGDESCSTIADSDKVKDGQPIAVSRTARAEIQQRRRAGVLSGKNARSRGSRCCPDREWPIEPVNSGGPVLDSAGKVVGPNRVD